VVQVEVMCWTGKLGVLLCGSSGGALHAVVMETSTVLATTFSSKSRDAVSGFVSPPLTEAMRAMCLAGGVPAVTALAYDAARCSVYAGYAFGFVRRYAVQDVVVDPGVLREPKLEWRVRGVLVRACSLCRGCQRRSCVRLFLLRM
jgi:hypothetical protein